MTLSKFRDLTLAAGFLAVVPTACAPSNAGPDDPSAAGGRTLAMVPVNHTDRYTVGIYVDKYWAGGAHRHWTGPR